MVLPSRHKVGLVVRLLGGRDTVGRRGAEPQRLEVPVVLQPEGARLVTPVTNALVSQFAYEVCNKTTGLSACL